ncbi:MULTISPECIES: rcc01693 family protein [unclassified Yoonia]|uniref:rcc01693 family protein n=1 Tax=unclassified Yoonia TaxID=2629118 RepID=UPI002AFF0FA4|nr:MULTISPECIES: rcc01693 family protein [unclassified Yoonia]
MTRLDWPGLLRAGLCTLRLQPGQFWALTPAELHLMLGAQAGPAPMTRAGLDALARAYPDDVKGNDDERS